MAKPIALVSCSMMEDEDKDRVQRLFKERLGSDYLVIVEFINGLNKTKIKIIH